MTQPGAVSHEVAKDYTILPFSTSAMPLPFAQGAKSRTSQAANPMAMAAQLSLA
jgi:hypothetical protein